MPWKEEYRSLRRSNSSKMGGRNSKHSVMVHDGVPYGTKKQHPYTDVGCGVMLLPLFLRRRKAVKDDKYFMDATTSRFFHGDATTSIGASCSTDGISDHGDSKSSDSSSSTGDDSSGSNGNDHILPHHRCYVDEDHNLSLAHNPTSTCCVDDFLMYSTDSDSFVDRYRCSSLLDSKSSEISAQSRSSSTIDAIIDDLLKNQDRSGFKKTTRPLIQSKEQIQIHHVDDSSASVCSHGTFRSILSTATPFCVFYDDDNNTIVTYKVMHRSFYENNRYFTNKCFDDIYHIPEPSDEIRYPHNVEDIANRFVHVPGATTKHHGIVTDVWSSNWNEMNDDDSITSAGTVLNRRLQPEQQEIVLVRSKYSYAQEDASWVNGMKTSPYRTMLSTKSELDNDSDSDVGFPWEAYKVAISSATVKKAKSTSRYLPNYFDRSTYTLVEL